MKRILVLAIAIVSFNSYAQESVTDVNDYEEYTQALFQGDKKEAIKEALKNSEEGAAELPAEFWSVYDEFEAENESLQNNRIDLIKEYSEKYDELSEENIDDLFNKYYAFEKAELKLSMTFYKKFKKVVSVSQAAKFMQLNNKINRIIDAKIAMEVPLLKSINN